MNNQHYLDLISEYLTIIDIVNLNKFDNTIFFNNNILYEKSLKKIVYFLKYVKNKKILDNEISNNENLYFEYTTSNYRKKLNMKLFFDNYSNEYRMSWYEQNGVQWKKSIVDKYKKGEFENKTSFTKYEFYRFQNQFTEEEIGALGF